MEEVGAGAELAMKKGTMTMKEKKEEKSAAVAYGIV